MEQLSVNVRYLLDHYAARLVVTLITREENSQLLNTHLIRNCAKTTLW